MENQAKEKHIIQGNFIDSNNPNDIVFLTRFGKQLSHLIFENAVLFHENFSHAPLRLSDAKNECVEEINRRFPTLIQYPQQLKNFLEIMNDIFDDKEKIDKCIYKQVLNRINQKVFTQKQILNFEF